MKQRCILCGRVSETGLTIRGHFLCAHCERSLLRPDGFRRKRYRRLLRLYGAGTAP